MSRRSHYNIISFNFVIFEIIDKFQMSPA